MLLILFCCTAADAANQRNQNFIIQAPTPQLAAAVAEAAERYRRILPFTGSANRFHRGLAHVPFGLWQDRVLRHRV